ncbi:helix-turn-helix transcriptional regulator [Desulfurivibrio sp. D14AmB]|uniref:helix-turn-helix transcriptional regulator n=1 Tax=Desulfurivibrio sp. D14AmB TaxID=3374370 RepID=UPI00376EC567
MSHPPQHTPPLTRQEAADFLGLKKGTLDVWATRGQGPRYLKLGRAVRYRLADLQEYMEQSVRSNTTEG